MQSLLLAAQASSTMKNLFAALVLFVTILRSPSARGQATGSPAGANVTLPPPLPPPEFTAQSCSVTSQSVTMNCGGSCADDEIKDRLRELEVAVFGHQRQKRNATSSRDCKDILDNDDTTPSGVYMVLPRDYSGWFNVFCDMDTDGGGWTVFQRRQDGTVDFYRGWADYKSGFPAKLNGEFWLGLDNLYRLAVQKPYELRVDMEDVEGNTAYAFYDTFAISPEPQNYNLHIGTYTGNAGDALSGHNGHPFSTKDRDNGGSGCAQTYKGVWWYESCHYSNLNGLYHLGTHDSYADGVNWAPWKGYYYSLKRTEMKIRPKA